MVKNVGGMDRILRILLGVLAIVYAVVSQSWWVIIIGAVLLGTGLMRFCPVYLPFKLSTAKKTETPSNPS